MKGIELSALKNFLENFTYVVEVLGSCWAIQRPTSLALESWPQNVAESLRRGRERVWVASEWCACQYSRSHIPVVSSFLGV